MLTAKEATWRRSSLRRVIKHYIGGGWGNDTRTEEFSEIGAVIRGTDIPGAILGQTNGLPRRFHRRSNIQSRRLSPGDIVFEVSGGSKEQPVGRPLFCSTELLAQLGGEAIPASFCKRIVANSEVVDSKFLYYVLSAIYLDRSVAQWQVQSTGISNFHFEAFLDECEIVAPPLYEQRRIASILSAYDDLIKNNTRRIAILGEIARRIYEEWFVRFRFPHDDALRMVESEFGPLPKGWHVKPLGEVVDDIVDYRGKTPAKLNGQWTNDGIPALSALNVKNGRLINLDKSRFVAEELYARWMQKPLRKGDILMTSEAPLGELFFLNTNERYCLSQRLFSIRADPRIICPAILYLTLESERTQNELASRATGATVSGIRQSELRKVPVIVPPPDIQGAIEPTLMDLALLKTNLDAACVNLRTTRDLLLPRLISGELDVSALAEPEAVAA